MLLRRTVLELLLASAAMPSVARAKTVLERFSSDGISFTVPENWSVEEAEDKGALYLLSPVIEGGVDASLLVELPQTVIRESIEEDLSRQATELESKYSGYRRRQMDSARRLGALEYGILEYSAIKQGVLSIEQCILVPLPRSRRIFIFTSTTERTAAKYLPLFERFVASVRIPQ